MCLGTCCLDRADFLASDDQLRESNRLVRFSQRVPERKERKERGTDHKLSRKHEERKKERKRESSEK